MFILLLYMFEIFLNKIKQNRITSKKGGTNKETKFPNQEINLSWKHFIVV